MKPQNTQNRQKKNINLDPSASSAYSAVLHYFDQVNEAPDAIPRLRRFVLDLAVRGKLVEQDPRDEPAAELLKDVEKEKGAFEIPGNWLTARVEKLLSIQYGKAISVQNRRDQGTVPIYGSNGIIGYCEEALTKVPAIIIGRKGSAGALNLCNGPSWTTDVAYFLIPPPFFNIRFLFIVLQTLDLGNLEKGVKPGLSRAEAYQLLIIVPPLAEQHRIVAKVDELMALCDKLEAAQQKRESRRDRLVTASLAKLTDETQNKKILKFSVSSACSAVSRPEHIQQLRQTILNLAVRGKLVLQDTKDEPVKHLISRIVAERKHRADGGEPVSKQTFTVLNENGFHIPRSWAWVKIGFVANVLMGQSPPGETYNIRGDGIPLINGPVEFSEGPFGTTVINQYTTAPTKLCRKGDLLLCVRGSTTGRTNIAGFDACIGRGVAALQPMYDDQFIRLFVWSWRDQIIEMGRGIAFPSISRQQIEDLPVPFPPFDEQNRIVAKVNEMMAICDKLESRVTITANTSRQLLEALL